MEQSSPGSRGTGSASQGHGPPRETRKSNLCPSALPAACKCATRPCPLWPPDASRQHPTCLRPRHAPPAPAAACPATPPPTALRAVPDATARALPEDLPAVLVV